MEPINKELLKWLKARLNNIVNPNTYCSDGTTIYTGVLPRQISLSGNRYAEQTNTQ